VQTQLAILSESRNRQDHTVTIVRYEANRVEVRVTAKTHVLLVLSDTWFPGWVARVNDSDSPVLRVNHTLRAVALKPGLSRVVFAYQPRSFTIGLTVSLTTLLAMIMMLAAARLRSQHLRRKQLRLKQLLKEK